MGNPHAHTLVMFVTDADECRQIDVEFSGFAEDPTPGQIYRMERAVRLVFENSFGMPAATVSIELRK